MASEIGVQKLMHTNATQAATINSSGQLIIDDGLQKSEGGAVNTSIQQGLSKSWARWSNQNTPTASDSLNLSSITDTATGRPDLNLTNNMDNANYAAGGFGQSGYSMMWDHASTSQIGVIVWYGGSYYDASMNSYIIQGDLA